MQTKLTLRLDSRLISRAKAYAASTGKSVSQVVADFFTRLESAGSEPVDDLSPRVRKLVGALRGKVSEADYRKYLDEKHR